MDGHGKFEWPDGRIYIGDYKEGKKDGEGEYDWSDGRIYKGGWKDGKQHGEGLFFCVKKKVWKKGIWENGKRMKWINENVNIEQEML